MQLFTVDIYIYKRNLRWGSGGFGSPEVLGGRPPAPPARPRRRVVDGWVLVYIYIYMYISLPAHCGSPNVEDRSSYNVII